MRIIGENLYPLILGHANRLICSYGFINRFLDMMLQLDLDIRVGTVDLDGVLPHGLYCKLNLSCNALGTLLVSNMNIQVN